MKDGTTIDPKALSRIKDLRLASSALAMGFLQGRHASIQRGTGIEFSQYRNYEPGDDPRRVDWKLFARSDRYFVREADRESELPIWLMLDCSASMAHQSERGPWNKFQCAKTLLAALAFLAHRQSDPVGSLGLATDQLEVLRPSNNPKQWHAILHHLNRLQCHGHFPELAVCESIFARLTKPALVVLVTDCYDRNDDILVLLEKLSRTRSEVLVFHLTCGDEELFPFKGDIIFEDLETHQRRRLDAREARPLYLERFSKFQADLERELLRKGIRYLKHNVDEPLDPMLAQFLKRREVLGQ